MEERRKKEKKKKTKKNILLVNNCLMSWLCKNKSKDRYIFDKRVVYLLQAPII